jgi:hypothetical protein
MRIRALSLMAVGVVIVALDFRIVALDVLPDVAGWLLIAAGAWKLALVRPSWLAVAAALASAPDALAPHHYENLAPFTGEVVVDAGPGTTYPQRLVFDHLHDLRLLLVVLATVAGGAAVWSLLGTLRGRAAAAGDHESAGRLGLLRWLVPSIWVAPYVTVAVIQGLGHDGFDPVWNGGFELLALLGLAVVGALAWVLAINSNRQWTATEADLVTPWGEMMIDHVVA